MAGVFTHLADDLHTLSQSTRVCRLWWGEGHKYIWRRVQPRVLFRNVKNVARRNHFASMIETLSFPADDSTLASEQMSSQPLSFPRLNSITLYKSNLIGVRPANLQSLIGPSLRSVSLEFSYDHSTNESDIVAFLTALLPCCATLTSLHLDLCSAPGSEYALLFALIGGLAAIEDLRLGEIAEELYRKPHAEEFLQLVLIEPRLVKLQYPHVVDITDRSVLVFLAQMGPSWSLPSLTYLHQPVFLSSLAAHRLLPRMPNLQVLELELEAFSDDLQYMFAALSRLLHLESLDLSVNLEQCNMDGALLAQLTELKQLETFWFYFRFPPTTVSLSGAQLASFLVSHPKLNKLMLGLFAVEAVCTHVEEQIINTALAKMEEVQIDDLMLVTQQPS
jgi:hypothetical protein